MSISAIGAGYQNQTNPPNPVSAKETQNPADPSERSRLNAEIEQAEAEMKETMKEAQKAAAKGAGGASEKAQLLQSKIQMQQQEIMEKQLQIKEMESPQGPAVAQASSATDARPDQAVAGKETAKPQGGEQIATITTQCNKQHRHDKSCPHTVSTKPAPRVGADGFLFDKTV